MSECAICDEESQGVAKCVQCEARVCYSVYCSVYCPECDGYYCPYCTCEHLDI